MKIRFKKVINIIISFSFIGVMLFFAISGIFLPDTEISYSERRKLAEFPEFSVEKLLKKDINGNGYFDALEKYLLDQFIARDSFRTLNVATRRYLFMQKDVNDIFTLNDRIFKMEYKLNEKAVERTADIYLKVINKYFSNNNANVYYTIVPDKNYYSAEASGYLSLDYDRMFSIMNEKLSGYNYIDIRGELTENDYYRTDLHWKQEKLFGVANKLLDSMGEAGNIKPDDYEYEIYEGFRGAYYGQAALPIEPDSLIYLPNNEIKNCKVFDYESGKYIDIYAKEKLGTVDTYDVFLHGPRAIITIENPSCTNGKELIIFRDSFGSSLAPLLLSAYSKITLLDIRYVSSSNLGRFIEFSENCDVLFMYNTGTLNTLGQGSIS